MKNLKRALSLVLSAAMMVGMMVMGTGAAVLTDVDTNDHDKAIGTIRVLGVMEGDENGNFNPDKTVTRNEMAVVMANLAGLKLNGAHPFSDVPTWADKYVGALYVNGLTSGTSATTYGGTTNVTTTTAALMIMKTLGYFEFQGEFGEDWEYATVKRASQLNLFKDIDAGVKEDLTRSELAQMIYNALYTQTVTVYEEAGMSVEGNGITVTEKAKYDYVKGATLIAKLFDGTLTEKTVYDYMDRPGKEYSYKESGKDAVKATIYETADETLIATKGIKLAKLIDDADLEYKNIPNMDLKAGYVVELFVNEDDAEVLDKVVIYYYYAAEIDEVEAADEDLNEKEFKDGAKYMVTFVNDPEDYADFELAGFDAKTFVEGAYILVPFSVNKNAAAQKNNVEIGDNKDYTVFQDLTVAKKVTGKATTVNTTDNFATIDDVKYVYAGDVAVTLTAGESYDVYVDANGYVVADAPVSDKAVIGDVYYVANIWVKDGKDAYNKQSVTVGAQLVDMNGVVSVVALETAPFYAEGQIAADQDAAAKAAWVGELVTISDKKWANGKAGNEKFDLAVWTGEDWNVVAANGTVELKKDTTRLMIDNDLYRLNADTKYILIGGDSADIKTEVKTGGIAVYEQGADVYVICPETAKSTVSYMIIVAGDEIEETAQYSKDLIFIKSKSNETGDGFVAQTVYMADGSKQVLKIADDQDIKTGFFKYTLNSDGFYDITKAADMKTVSVWEDEEGVIVNTTVTAKSALYEGMLTVAEAADIKVADAKFVDAHTTTGTNDYTKTLSTLAKVMEVVDKGYKATLSMNVSEDGAVIIILTDLSK